MGCGKGGLAGCNSAGLANVVFLSHFVSAQNRERIEISTSCFKLGETIASISPFFFPTLPLSHALFLRFPPFLSSFPLALSKISVAESMRKKKPCEEFREQKRRKRQRE